MGKIDEVLEIVRLIQADVAQIKSRMESYEEETKKPKAVDLKFPLTTGEELAKFEADLANAEKFNDLAKRFKEELIDRSASTTYYRRKCLKELLFSR